MISLERRLVVGLVVALLVVFGVLFVGAVTAVRSLSEAYVATRLEHDAETLVAAFGVNPRGAVRLREGRITPIYQQPLSGHYFVFRLDGGPAIRSRSLWDEDLAFDPARPGQPEVRRHAGPNGQLLLTRTARYRKSGIGFTLLVAEDLTPMLAHITRFQRSALILLLVALLVIVAVQRIVLRRGFRGLDRVRTELHEVATGSRQQIATLGPSEIRPLTAEVNRLLTGLQQRLQRSRQALGNLAHALKTPLSLADQDVASLPLDREDQQRLSRRLDRIGQLIERELKRARFAGEHVGRRFDPGRDVPDLVEAVAQLYRDRALEFAVTPLPHGRLRYDREDMLELLGNLLDNAAKWARARVELTVTTGEGLLIRIADDGPGLGDHDLDDLPRRGGRLDEQQHGHGLGLAIVRDLVEGYGGELGLHRSETLGGLEVQVSLPGATALPG